MNSQLLAHILHCCSIVTIILFRYSILISLVVIHLLWLIFLLVVISLFASDMLFVYVVPVVTFFHVDVQRSRKFVTLLCWLHLCVWGVCMMSTSTFCYYVLGIIIVFSISFLYLLVGSLIYSGQLSHDQILHQFYQGTEFRDPSVKRHGNM